jgi:hypothetical protein
MNGLTPIKGKPDGVTEVTIGRNISLKNKKNKFGEPYRESSFYISFVDDGILKVGETDVVAQLVELGSLFQLISRSGNVYTYGSVKANGIENFKNKLRESGEVDNLKQEVYKHINKR